MATPKNHILGQLAPTGTSYTSLLVAGAVPVGHQYVVSTFTINARNGVNALCSVRFRLGGAAATNASDWWTDVPVKVGRPHNLTFGLTFYEGDIVEVKSSIADALSFTMVGADIS